MQIMMLEHPHWPEFIAKLRGPEGCDIQKEKSRRKKKTLTWKCGGPEKPLARHILKEFDDIDVQGSLDYLEKHGGRCDCEILMSVAFRGKPGSNLPGF